MLDRFHSKDVQINEDLDFSSLVQHPALLAGLVEAGYQRPSPIQLKAIPLGRLGLDLIAQAKSGTGKTIVFSVIAIEAALSGMSVDSEGSGERDPLRTKAVIIAPTREIAVQIHDVILNLTRTGLQEAVTCHSMIGGMPIQKDKEHLKRCSIVVGTPGRVRSLIATGHLAASQVRLLVLDEADKLMEDVFKEDVLEIAKGLGANKQVMAFSATYDDDLLSQLDRLVKNPVYVMLSNGTPELEGVLQYFKVATLDEKHSGSPIIMRQAHIMEAKFSELENLLTHVPFYQAIVFLNHRGRASDLVKFLTRRGWPAMHIASGISQEERLDVMMKARKFELRILVCSDLIARGIDIDRVNLVVNLDMPKDPETYLHRVGRTGRYGTTGLAVNIVSEEELKTVEILKLDYGITIERLSSDDSQYIELSRSSKNRHHERPLQGLTDFEQFKKLEAERIEGERRALVDDKVTYINHSECNEESQERRLPLKRAASEASLELQQSAYSRAHSKKRREFTQDRHSLITPEMTPPVVSYDIGSTQGIDGVYAEEDSNAGSQHHIESVDYSDGSGLVNQNVANPYHSYYPCISGTPVFYPLSFVPFSHNYPGAFFESHYRQHTPFYSTVAPKSTTAFLPPDLPLFPIGSLPPFNPYR
ncbi:DEAD (Asp-Glu-Ala-Asp) box polypeptide 20 [Mortierella sp. AM989]|nr:DEAD (Asp-Glu-Ala-Asp) box polypeptide 20 [Mortierella sp. AM989]